MLKHKLWERAYLVAVNAYGRTGIYCREGRFKGAPGARTQGTMCSPETAFLQQRGGSSRQNHNLSRTLAEPKQNQLNLGGILGRVIFLVFGMPALIAQLVRSVRGTGGERSQEPEQENAAHWCWVNDIARTHIS